MKKVKKPEYLEYAQYYEPYIELVQSDISVLDQLKKNSQKIATTFLSTPEEKLLQPYTPGKWSLKDLLMHMIDTERVFLYRAMRFARRDQTPLPFFDENNYATEARANDLNTRKLIKEYTATRQASLTFFNNLSASQFKHTGMASQFNMSVRACAWIICGHELHHWSVMLDRYGLEPKQD